MEGDTLSKWRQFEPFFGGDGRARLFCKYFLKGFGATQAINYPNAETIVDTMAYDIMTAKNYTNKKEGMSDNDIHYEFSDFIVNTANSHKSIDKQTEAGTILGAIRTAINMQDTKVIDDAVKAN